MIQVMGRAGTFTWRMLATVLAAQSILIFFGALVARGTDIAQGGDGGNRLLVGSAVAGLAIVAAGLMRGPLGLPLGWLVQVATWLSALVVPAMIGVGVVFTGLWVYSLVKGPRVEAMMARRAEEAPVEGPDGPAPSPSGDPAVTGTVSPDPRG
jgi:hypothetical protein